jgi:diguanylate cyclase (GGDEF)-like protein
MFKSLQILPSNMIPYDGQARIVMPIAHGTRVFGHAIYSLTNDSYSITESMTSGLAAALNSIEMMTKLHDASRHDELTGLLNRRGFMEIAQQTFNLSNQNDLPGAVLFADLDGLKRINDTYGHSEGDEALREIAKLLKSALRDTDIVGRIGGDEFLIMAINVDDAYAGQIARRIALAVDKFNSRSKKPWHLGVSIGSKLYIPQENLNFETVINAADEALYAVKKANSARHQLVH